MDLIPSKRRKLDHNLRNIPPQDDLSETKPESRPKRTQDDEDGAVYAGGFYKSSIFKLQVDEMLEEVRPNYAKQLHSVDNSLRRLKDLIEGIEDRGPLSVSCVHYLEEKTLPYSLYIDSRSCETPTQVAQGVDSISRP